MSWVKIPDLWLESDDVEALGSDAVVLHLSALAYCSRQGTDGRLPIGALRRLWPVADTATAIKALEVAGEWQQAADGWLLINWRNHLLSAAEMEHRREVSRQTSERYRRHKAGDHSMCERCSFVKRGDVSGDASRDVSVTSLVTSRLVSSRNEVRETRGEQGGDDAAAATSPRREWDAPHPFTAHGHGFDCAECPLPAGHPIHAGAS